MGKLTKVVSHASGWSGAKSAGRELRAAVMLPVGLFRGIADWYQDAKAAAVEDRRLAELDSEQLWDMMVVEYEITTTSVRKKYRIATLVNAILILSLAGIVGNAVGQSESGTPFLVANALFANIALMLLFQNAYRLNMAYSQSAPPVGQFLKSVMRRPMLLIAKALPRDYAVRGEPK